MKRIKKVVIVALLLATTLLISCRSNKPICPAYKMGALVENLLK